MLVAVEVTSVQLQVPCLVLPHSHIQLGDLHAQCGLHEGCEERTPPGSSK